MEKWDEKACVDDVKTNLMKEIAEIDSKYWFMINTTKSDVVQFISTDLFNDLTIFLEMWCLASGRFRSKICHFTINWHQLCMPICFLP